MTEKSCCKFTTLWRMNTVRQYHFSNDMSALRKENNVHEYIEKVENDKIITKMHWKRPNWVTPSRIEPTFGYGSA